MRLYGIVGEVTEGRITTTRLAQVVTPEYPAEVPPRQEDYDASKDAFDLNRVYVAIQAVEDAQREFAGQLLALKKIAYEASRALETERMQVKRLEAQLEAVASGRALDAAGNLMNDGGGTGV